MGRNTKAVSDGPLNFSYGQVTRTNQPYANEKTSTSTDLASLGLSTRRDTESVKRKPGHVCPIGTMSREDCHLSIIVKRNRDAAVSQLPPKLYAATGAIVSRVTVSRRLH
ncbi:hypothetical protein TNCV_1416081 [Trichonephila clavipes]|nr:hypothetical protein TNCV_1416081 [Trichonephila clavipes]